MMRVKCSWGCRAWPAGRCQVVRCREMMETMRILKLGLVTSRCNTCSDGMQGLANAEPLRGGILVIHLNPRHRQCHKHYKQPVTTQAKYQG